MGSSLFFPYSKTCEVCFCNFLLCSVICVAIFTLEDAGPLELICAGMVVVGWFLFV